MYIKHVPFGDASAELYQAETGRFDYGVAVLLDPNVDLNTAMDITGWKLGSLQVRIDPDGHFDNDGQKTWVVRWIVQAQGATGLAIFTSGDLYILGDNGKTIDRVR